MDREIIELDLGEKTAEARNFKRVHPEMRLGAFLRLYPARLPAGRRLSRQQLDAPLENYVLQPIMVHGEGTTPLAPPPAAAGPDEAATDGFLRARLDSLWQEEQRRLTDFQGEFPAKISDNEAVRTAYRREMDDIADYLQNGLSVLVVCDKILTEYIYEFVCHRAGREVVLDGAAAEPPAAGVGTRLERAVGGSTPADPLAELPGIYRHLRPQQVLVLRSLDMLDSPPLIELLYQRTIKGEKAQLLAFLDPSLEVSRVLSHRFAVQVSIMGLSRYVDEDAGAPDRPYTVTRLLTERERQCFADYDPEGLYKNVAGLNAVQFRNAMRYVGAKTAPGTPSTSIYRVIRQFKISSDGEIEIPDTTFADIGGYEPLKKQLQNIIELISGPIAGLEDRHRGQLIPRGFVFHGPPGTGKTLFAKAIANELNATIQMVSGPEIMDKYVGQSENNLRQLFATARRNAPAVIFFDEFDSIASQRSTYADGGARANNAVVAQLLTELDGFRRDQTVLVIGTTNRIDIIDEALLRPSRLHPVEIGLPDWEARRQVADLHARGFGIHRLLVELCRQLAACRDGWPVAGANDSPPPELLASLLAEHRVLAGRCRDEATRLAVMEELKEMFAVLAVGREMDGNAMPAIAALRERFLAFGRRYGLDFTAGKPPTAAGQLPADLATAINDLYRAVCPVDAATLAAEEFYEALLDLVAEHTAGFNNDELRAVFQEASLERHLEGRLPTPRYLGGKIGQISRRRRQRHQVHLGG